MEVHEFILQKIRNNSLKNMYVFGEGGIGKSYALRRLYSRLLNDEYSVGAKRVLPIYIPLAEVSIRGNKNETCIRQYIWNNYSCGQPTGRNTVTNLDSQILNAPNSRYHFILLCDGINENANGTALRTEISVLASYENITICLTGRSKLEWLNDFEFVEVAPLDLERLRKIVGSYVPVSSLSDETLDLLRNPFNLTQWLGLSEADKADDYTKSKLLKRHIDRLVDLQNQHNSAQKYLLGNLTIYHETALKYVLRFLGALSWEMENENNMVISVNCPAWKRAKALYPDELKNELKIIKEEIFENFLIPLGLFRRIDDKNFIYSHQNYRDYFAARFLYDDNNFGDFEYKISTYTISDSVLEFFAGFFKNKDSLYEFAHEVNERISQCDALKANAVLNKNLVRLFKETSNSIVNETFSNRDLCLSDFNDFYELLDCDFSNSKFGEDTLWISSDGWGYDSPGKFFVTSKYLILNDSRKCTLFDIHTLKFIQTQCEARECFEYQNATYIASVEKYYDDDYVVVKNIENDDSFDIDLSLKEAAALIESESPHLGDICIYDIFVKDISFCTLNSCLYILFSKGKLSQLFVYNFNCSSSKIINDVCFLGATNQNNTKHTYYYSKEDGLVILSDVGEFTIGFFEKERQYLYYNAIIDCYFINNDWVVITDTYIFSTGFPEHILFIPSKYIETTYDENINRTEKILDLANISSPCTLEFGLVVETEYDSYSNLIYMLVRENDCEQLLVYNPKNNTLSSCMNNLMENTGRWAWQKRMFIEKRNLYIFANDTLNIGLLSNSKKITFSNKKLDLQVFDVIKIDSGFALYDAFHSPEMPKMQKINFYGSTIFENKAHLIPSCIEMNCVNNQFSILLKNHNHKPFVAFFGSNFVLKSIRYFSNAPVNYTFSELMLHRAKGWIRIAIQQIDKESMYFGVGDKDFGLYIYKYDSEINQYGFLCQISSSISHGLNEFPFLNEPNALIPNLYEAEVLSCNNSALLLKGTSRTEEKHYTAENKYYRVDLEQLQYCEIEIWNCDDTIFFDNSDLLLYTKDNSVHLYNMRSKIKTDLNDLNPMFFGENQEIDWVQEQNSDNLKQSFFSSFLQLVRCGKECGVYFENHLIWLSEINSKSVLTILSLKEKRLLIHEICDCMHEIILKYDELCHEVYVINESFVFDDDDLLTVDIFRNSDHGFERSTYVIDNPNISLNSTILKNNKLYFIDSTGLHSRALNDEEESKLNVYPFDKNITGSNFNGCQFNERQKRILTQYGAKPFTENKEEN